MRACLFYDFTRRLGMRPISHGDVACVALVVQHLPELRRQGVILRYLVRADAADAYRKKFGQVHPRWGNGSLMAAVGVKGLQQEPFLGDLEYCRSFAAVLEAIILWRCDSRARGTRGRRAPHK
jgi:hypothetical protein